MLVGCGGVYLWIDSLLFVSQPTREVQKISNYIPNDSTVAWVFLVTQLLLANTWCFKYYYLPQNSAFNYVDSFLLSLMKWIDIKRAQARIKEPKCNKVQADGAACTKSSAHYIC